MIDLAFRPDRADDACDIDGTYTKFTTLEQYTLWASREQLFDPLPHEISALKQAWRDNNDEANYNRHTAAIVEFFIAQVAGKAVSDLQTAAEIVARQQRGRTWDITRAIVKERSNTHNQIAISHMPEWLLEPFVRGAGFVALIGSTYLTRDGIFTGEAYKIDKLKQYKQLRGGDTSRLEIVMENTNGGLDLLQAAKHPIAVNPSHTLTEDVRSWATILRANADSVTVIQPAEAAPYPSYEFECSQTAAILTHAGVRLSDIDTLTG